MLVCVFSLQESGVYSYGEDQTGAAGQLYLVWQEEETVQRQVSGQAQRRYTKVRVHPDIESQRLRPFYTG